MSTPASIGTAARALPMANVSSLGLLGLLITSVLVLLLRTGAP